MSKLILALAYAITAAAQDSNIESYQTKMVEPNAMRENLELFARKAPEAEQILVGIGGQCHVDSRCDFWIKVYINGRYRGTIPPWGDIYPLVGDCHDECTHLYAVSTCGRYYWQRTVYGSFGDYHWILRR